MPTKSNKIHRMDYPEEHYRTFLGDSAVKTDTIGSENDRVLKMFCYDAEWGEMCQSLFQKKYLQILVLKSVGIFLHLKHKIK